MKKSIRIKLFIGINSIVLFFMLLSWTLNNVYLKKYYLSEKKNILIKNSATIDKLYKGNPSDISLDLEKLENSKGLNIIILSESLQTKYSSFSRIINQSPLLRKGPSSYTVVEDFSENIPVFQPSHGRQNNYSYLLSKNEMENGKYIFQIENDFELKIDFLTLKFTLHNGDLLLLRTPLPVISESVSIANRFAIFTGIFIFILGSVGAFILSQRFSKPILQLRNIAKNIGDLDFSEKCTLESGDELSDLGKSINFLSSELRNAIAEINRRNQKLIEDIEKERKADEIRKEFVSNVSHELKTPIALIQGYAEGLKLNVIDDEENKIFYCDVIMSEADRMHQLVKDLLNLSQIESGYFKIDKTVFDLSALIDQISSKFKPIFEQLDIEYSIEKEEIILVAGDVSRIEQVLVNYINNAFHHVSGEKKIKIKVTKLEHKIHVAVFNSGNHVPEEAFDKIWLSFYKVDKARTRGYSGSGLGLSIVRAIQELHQNEYGIENVEDGVVFWFHVDVSS